MPDIFFLFLFCWRGWGGGCHFSTTLLSLASRRAEAEGVCGLKLNTAWRPPLSTVAITAKQAQFYLKGVALVAVTSAWAFLAPLHWDFCSCLIIHASETLFWLCMPLLKPLESTIGFFHAHKSGLTGEDFFCSVHHFPITHLPLPPTCWRAPRATFLQRLVNE